MRLACVAFSAAIIVLLASQTETKVFQINVQKDGDASHRKPVLLIPGVLGSRLQAKLNISGPSPGPHCYKKWDWFDLWLNLNEFWPRRLPCWVYDISMSYKRDPQHPGNNEGIDIRLVDFGGTSSFEYIDSNPEATGSPYFNKLVDYLISRGYKRHDDLKGAPYDWRLTPSLDQDLLTNLTKLVEDNYYQHFNRKVVIIGHSMGNMFVYYFLKHQPQIWKDKFIDSFISINSPYLGSVKALKSITSGETEGHDFILSATEMRTAARTFPSSYFLLPRPSYWPRDKSVVVSTLTRNYTVLDYNDLFEDIQCDECWERFNNFGKEMGNLSAPGVEVHCVYSSEVPTTETLSFGSGSFPDGTPELKYGDGDGTVNTFSSSYCLQWREQQKHPVHDVLLPGNSHGGILNNKTLHNYIGSVISMKLPRQQHLKHVRFDLL